ncbi:MAG: PAS domain S-box protein, partial [Candidatus Thermoplasmatota archaeon]|nr:PAS domain S-box protein [Candidatus Thermoplasmatota archaeon]
MTLSKASLPLETCLEILNLGNDLIAIHDGEGNRVYVSPSIRDILGYFAEELIGKPEMDIVHPDDIPEARNLFSQVLQNPGKTFKGDLCLRNKNGDTIVVNYRVTNLLHNPKVQGIVINYHDVTDRKKTEQQLRESEEKYHNLVEHAQDGVVIVQDGVFKFVNSAWCRICGYQKEDLLNASFLET